MKAAAGEPAAVMVPVAVLRPWAGNPRKNDPAVDEVAASIKRFGFGSPIIARQENGEVIAGHTRLKAAIRLKLAAVPVRYLDLSAEEAHAYALADNKLGEIATWDQVPLADAFRELEKAQVDLSGLGWDGGELEKLLGKPRRFAVDPDDDSANPILGNNLIYRVVVDVAGEAAQATLIEQLESQGYKCVPLIS